MENMTATIDLEFLVLWLKSREPSVHIEEGFDLDALTDAVDELDAVTVDFLMSEIGKADLDVTRELVKVLEEPVRMTKLVCKERLVKHGTYRTFSFAREVKEGAQNCKPVLVCPTVKGRKNSGKVEVKMAELSRGCEIAIPHVQRMLAQITANKEKERKLDWDC